MPRDRSTAFSTFSVGVRGKLGHEVDVAGSMWRAMRSAQKATRSTGARTSPARTTTATMTSSSPSSLGTP